LHDVTVVLERTPSAAGDLHSALDDERALAGILSGALVADVIFTVPRCT
jgi:hypothetical protein